MVINTESALHCKGVFWRAVPIATPTQVNLSIAFNSAVCKLYLKKECTYPYNRLRTSVHISLPSQIGIQLWIAGDIGA